MQPVMQTVEPVTQAIQPVTQPVTQTIEPVTQTIQPVTQLVPQTVEPVMQSIQPVTQTVTQTIEPVTQTIEPVTQTVTHIIQPVTQTIEPVTQPVTQTIQPVTQLVTQTIEPVTQAVEPVMQPVMQTIQPVTQLVGPVMQTIQPVTQLVPQTVEPVMQSIQPVTQLVEPVTHIIQPVTQTIEPVTQPVTQTIQPVTQAATLAFDQFVWQNQASSEQLALWWINLRMMNSAASSTRMTTEFLQPLATDGVHGQGQTLSKAKQNMGPSQESPDEIMEPLPDQGSRPPEMQEEGAGDVPPLLPGQVLDLLVNFPLALAALDDIAPVAVDQAERLLDETRELSVSWPFWLSVMSLAVTACEIARREMTRPLDDRNSAPDWDVPTAV